MISFVAINDYGNGFFMDNVNINGQNILTIEEDENMNILTAIYPNPTKGVFNIRTNAEEMNVEIYSTLGKLIASKQIHAGIQEINLSGQSKGVYFITLTHNGITRCKRLVIQ